ncbi:SDR family NAD(P)-dependent oxidoreductase [Halocatena pleomorpha]|uniref:SDR family oxidoreductase n=1 Tax=Halocatena pleomorpha TaxID=1785090 RepID=A0A3P3R6U9_9EURY|nr:SDR family oxidoreductase [Halocatena pleomorpha]RRJ29114.1 SDR family oxidoreductase [Halocatena pleomorpha]
MGTPTYDFDAKTVIVTGGSSGIGRETALRFADAGATVVIGDVRTEPKDVDETTPTHELINAAGGTAAYVETDVTDPDAIESLVVAAREHGGVDVMVNNAGLHIETPLRELTPEAFDRIHAVNVRGVFFGCQAAANDMIDRDQGGVIVNTASISSSLAQFGQVQYDSTKGAIRMVTRGAALELAEHDIRVAGVAPGQIATEFLDGWTEEATTGAQEDAFLKPIPMGRAGHPEDVAGAYLFLASDDASYITGELLHVDGGWQIC